MPAPFPGRTLLPRRQQGTTNGGTIACSSHSESWLVYAWWKLEHGTHSCFPLHTWTLTFWFGPWEASLIYTECYKRNLVGTSAQPYFVSYARQQVRCYICLYTPQVCEVADRQYWMCLLDLFGILGSSDSGGVQDLAREQLVRETAHWLASC
jgi:hypothetical protein